MYGKFKIIILTLVMILATMSTMTTGLNVNESHQQFYLEELSYSFEKPTFSPITICGEQFTRVNVEGCSLYGNLNEPRLPVKPLTILLPQGKAIEEIIVEINGENTISMDGYSQIELGVGARNLNQPPENEPPVPEFDGNSLYPGKYYEYIGVQSFRGYSILHLNLYPVQYFGNTNTIHYYTQMTVEVRNENAPINPLYRGLPQDQEMIATKVDNVDPLIMNTYETGNIQEFSSFEYVIITTDAFESYSGSNDFNDLIDARENQGLTATIKTVEDIYSEYSGSSNQEKIRNFIIDAYLNWDTSFVLIGGDVEYVPIRDGFHSEYEPGITSDVYYMCLDGDYNYDGDNRYGEPNDGVNGGWIDLYAEVYVGRASVDNTDQIDNFVRKTLDYENSDWGSDSYLEEILSVGEYVWGGAGGWGAGYVELCIDHDTDYGQDTHGIPSDIYTITELYERDMNPDWTDDDLIDEIEEGMNIMNHLGHASPTSCSKLVPSDIAGLTNTEYGFWYSQGCHSGQMEAADECMSEAWVVYNGGGYGSIMNSGYGFGSGSDYDGPSNRYAREFYDALYYGPEVISSMGIAHADSREDNLWHINQSSKYMYHCCYSINLIGDPFLRIKGAEDFGADFSWGPEYPRTDGPVYFQDKSVGATSRHWDFGDGEGSSYTNPSHQYDEEGIYGVTLTIYGGGESDSVTRSVEVWDDWPPFVIATPEFYAGNNPVVCFDGSSSWDPDGAIVSYHWDFDDGGTSDQVAPCHTFTEDGIYDVVLAVTDDGGNTGYAYCEIRMDSHTPPVTEAVVQGSYGKNGWLKSNAEIYLDASDWTGVEYTKYRVDGGAWTTFTDSFQIWTNGYHDIDFYSVDVYGNTEDVKSVDIKIDTGKPTLNVDIAGDMVDDWYISPVTVTCSASDSGSGLNAIFYRLDGVLDWSVYEGPFTISIEGEYVLRIYSEDMAGNTFGNNNPFSLKIDTAPPETTYTLDGEGADGMYYMNVTVGLSAVDTGIGLDATYYKLDGGNWTMYSDSFMVTSVGSHTLGFYSVDMLGKEETVQSVDFSINVINFDMEITNPGSGLYLFGNKFINIQRTIIIGAITVEATLMPYDPGSEPDYDYVEFFIDDVSKATVTTAPFEWTWDEQAFGEHTIKVVAYHSGESVTDSMVATIFHL
jgi:PKD repeat protein